MSYFYIYKITNDINGNYNVSKAVYQLNKETCEIINEFESLKHANDVTGFNFRGISRVCSGERESAYGFIWRFKCS